MIVSGSVEGSAVSAISAELSHKTDQAHAAWQSTRGKGPEEAVDAAWRKYSQAYDARVQFSNAVALTKAVLDT